MFVGFSALYGTTVQQVSFKKGRWRRHHCTLEPVCVEKKVDFFLLLHSPVASLSIPPKKNLEKKSLSFQFLFFSKGYAGREKEEEEEAKKVEFYEIWPLHPHHTQECRQTLFLFAKKVFPFALSSSRGK